MVQLRPSGRRRSTFFESRLFNVPVLVVCLVSLGWLAQHIEHKVGISPPETLPFVLLLCCILIQLSGVLVNILQMFHIKGIGNVEYVSLQIPMSRVKTHMLSVATFVGCLLSIILAAAGSLWGSVIFGMLTIWVTVSSFVKYGELGAFYAHTLLTRPFADEIRGEIPHYVLIRFVNLRFITIGPTGVLFGIFMHDAILGYIGLGVSVGFTLLLISFFTLKRATTR